MRQRNVLLSQFKPDSRSAQPTRRSHGYRAYVAAIADCRIAYDGALDEFRHADQRLLPGLPRGILCGRLRLEHCAANHLPSQITAAVPSTFAVTTQPIPMGTNATVQSYIASTYGSSFQSLNLGQAKSSWPEKYEISSFH